MDLLSDKADKNSGCKRSTDIFSDPTDSWGCNKSALTWVEVALSRSKRSILGEYDDDLSISEKCHTLSIFSATSHVTDFADLVSKSIF
jgi:hypothetical protein